MRKLWWRFNMKNEFHRKITLFLSGICQIAEIATADVNQTMKELKRKRILSEVGFQNIRFLFAKVYYMRVKQYLPHGQEDNMYTLMNYFLSKYFFDILTTDEADRFFSVLTRMEEIIDDCRQHNKSIDSLQNEDLCSDNLNHMFEVRDRYDYLGNNLNFEAKVIKNSNAEVSQATIRPIYQIPLKLLHFYIVSQLYRLIENNSKDFQKLSTSSLESLLLNDLLQSDFGKHFYIASQSYF